MELPVDWKASWGTRRSPIIMGSLSLGRVDVSKRNTPVGLGRFGGPPVQATALSLSMSSKVLVALRGRRGKHLEA